MVAKTAQVDGNYGLGQNTDAGFHGQGGPEGDYPCLRIPITGYYQSVQVPEGVSDDRQKSRLMFSVNTLQALHRNIIVGSINFVMRVKPCSILCKGWSIFTTKIAPSQSKKMCTAPKASQRRWMEHFSYLTSLSDAFRGEESLGLGKTVHYTDATMRTKTLSRMDLNRADYLR